VLDPSDPFAAQIARNGEPEPFEFEETDTTFAISWKGHHHIDGSVFLYTDQASGRVVTTFGYPASQTAQLATVQKDRGGISQTVTFRWRPA
jgi:hypothetical protein